MSERDRIYALVLIAFAVLSVPLGLSLAAILGYLTLSSILRLIEGGTFSDALYSLVLGALFILVSLGVRHVVIWLKK